MKNFISILISMIVCVYGISFDNINQDNVESYLSPNHSVVAQFIEDNLDVFRNEYNKSAEPDEYFMGSYCEHKIEVVIISEFGDEEDSYGTYLDFDNNNGYMIIADNYEVILFETSGDLLYLKDVSKTYYSLFDGFGFISEENIFIPYRSFLAQQENELTSSKKHYKGQDPDASGNDGEIENTDLYVKDKYGKGYSCINDVDISQKRNGISFDYQLQYDTSLYYENLSNNGSRSEGNCVLNSIFQLLNYYQKCGLCSNLPSLEDKTFVDITKDYFYEKYVNNDKYFMYSKDLPNLYLKIREIAINKYGYRNEDIDYFKIDNLIRAVLSKYGYSLKVENIWLWSFQSEVKNQINEGYPILWSMANSSTYGAHTTVVTGYKQYRKIKKIWFIKIKHYVNFMQLADNWNSEKRYFDFTHYYAFGGFTSVRG